MSVTATHGQSFTASSLFTYSDPFGDAATQYDFWDTGSGGGHFVLNGVALGANQENIVSAAQLAQLSYQSGSGTDTLWVQASDGAQWSPWSNAFTVTGPVDTGPVVTPTSMSVTAAHGQSFTASSLFTYSEPFGDMAWLTKYDFWDTGSGGGHFVLNGVALGANRGKYCAQVGATGAAQLSERPRAQIRYGCKLLTARNGAPGRTPSRDQPGAGRHRRCGGIGIERGDSERSKLCRVQPVHSERSVRRCNLTQYDFWDTGAGGGHFVLNGSPLGGKPGHNIVTAPQEAQLTSVSGSGTDTLWVRVGAGGQWSSWSQSFTVSDPATIGVGATLELPSAYSGTLSFAGATGTLGDR